MDIPKIPPTWKAQWYLDKYSDVNEAFNKAKWEDGDTLRSIYDQGGVDVNAPNKLNMFNWSITAHGVCDPYFLELMFKHNREDIKTDGQKVFEAACEYGDTRHIEVFMKRHNEYKWDLFKGMKSTIGRDNRNNFHHLLMYKGLSDEEVTEIWNRACGEYISGVKIFEYMVCFYNCIVTKEQLIQCMIYHFCDTLIPILKTYLKSNEPFNLDKDLIEEILTKTNDRIYKLEMLNKFGFKVDNLEEIKSRNLSKASINRWIELNTINFSY
jgi:hypothetical protein